MAVPVPGSNMLDMYQAAGINYSGLSSQPGASTVSYGKISPSSPIYMGKTTLTSPYGLGSVAKTGPYAGGINKPPKASSDRTMTYAEAQMEPLSWDPSTLSKFVNSGILYKVPGFGANMGMPEVMDQWDNMLQRAFTFSQKGDKKWTPWDVVNSYNTGATAGEIKQGDWMVDAATNAKIKYVGPRSTTQVNKHVDLSSAEDVQAITTNALTQLLGRAPTDKEVAQYKATINGYEKAHPQSTTTTTQISAEGVAGDTSSTTTGGATDAGRQALISQGAVGTPEYNKYQAGTTYYNALLAMIGGA